MCSLFVQNLSRSYQQSVPWVLLSAIAHKQEPREHDPETEWEYGMQKSALKPVLARRSYGFTLVLSLLPFLPAPARSQAQTAKPSAIALHAAESNTSLPIHPWQSNNYIIGPEDVLNVDILDVTELSHEYRVSNDGTIYVAILPGPISAAGLTLPQFTTALSKELQSTGMVADPHLTVTVSESRSHSIGITGAVRKPQIYPVFSQTTLLDAFSQAEGLADDASSVAIVHRGDIAVHALGLDKQKDAAQEQNDAFRTVTVDLKGLMENKDANLNVVLYPGDRITVPRAGIVYVLGAVNKPGGFTMKSNSHGITVVQAVALAEDTKSTSVPKHAVIIRNDPEAPEGHKQIPVDLKKIMRGKAPDPMLQAEDILFVPDSAAKRTLHRGAEAALQVTSGVLIYSSRF
jgi:polysaccharide biosynthesis/export protein